MQNNLDGKLDYVPLCPHQKLEGNDYSSYFDFIEYTLTEEQINNIALMGNYGVGKSSILKSFFNYNPQFKKKSFNISFMTFNDLNYKRSLNENNLDLQIEYKIIEQLVYKLNPKDIRYSKFSKTITPINKSKIFKIVILFITMFISLSALLELNFINNIYLNNSILFKNNRILYFFTFILSLFFIIYNIMYYMIDGKKIPQKISIKDFTINMNSDVDTISPFDNYLNEVIYLIKSSKKEIFVFEDLDRYGTNLILSKLREINNMINNDHDNLNKFKFIYLIRDDLFTSEERVKFFDIIIPVLPTSPNKTKFEELKPFMYDNEDSISDIYYLIINHISDIRILNNIYNEFIFLRNLNFKKNSYNSISIINHDIELLAIITFKNIFPYDFSQLLNNKGVFFEIMNDTNITIPNTPKQVQNQNSILKYKMKQDSLLDNLNLNNEHSNKFIQQYISENPLNNLSDKDYLKFLKEFANYSEDDHKISEIGYIDIQIDSLNKEIERDKERLSIFFDTLDETNLTNGGYVNPNYINLFYRMIDFGYLNHSYNDYLYIFGSN